MTPLAKLRAAMRAIDSVFGDTRVPPEATLEALEEIQTDLEFKIEALKSDLKKRQGVK